MAHDVLTAVHELLWAVRDQEGDDPALLDLTQEVFELLTDDQIVDVDGS